MLHQMISDRAVAPSDLPWAQASKGAPISPPVSLRHSNSMSLRLSSHRETPQFHRQDNFGLDCAILLVWWNVFHSKHVIRIGWFYAVIGEGATERHFRDSS